MRMLQGQALAISLLAILMGGCGQQPSNTSTHWPADAPLVPADSEAFAHYMKAGLSMVEDPEFRTGNFMFEPVAMPSGAPEQSLDTDSGSSPTFSTTNLQTLGVDEADRVKFDGEFLYVARSSELRYVWPEPEPEPEPLPIDPTIVIGTNPEGIEIDDGDFSYPEIEVISPAQVVIYRTSEDPASASLVALIKIDSPVEIEGMLMLPPDGDQPALLVVVASEWGDFFGGRISFGNPWFHNTSRLHVRVFDVNDPVNPELLLRWHFEGSQLATRQVGNQLILVSSFAPFLQPLNEATNRNEREQLLEDATVEDLLPRSWFGEGAEATPLVTAESCFVPADESLTPQENPEYYQPVLATIAMLNLRDLNEWVSVCAAGPVDRVYSSTQSLYLASTRYAYSPLGSETSTVVHKFAYSESGPRFRGSGETPGAPAGSQPTFGLGEYGNTFGILTSAWMFDAEPRNRLTLFQEDPGGGLQLIEVAHLPNDSQPEPIGKPGERIYGVRFVGDRIYLVTFRQVDPLYVIDISDVSTPFLAGELELPGFSDYLQPLGQGLLLGIGMHSIPTPDGIDLFQGVKIELFDVSDPSALRSLDSLEVGLRGSGTAARYDHQAVNWLDLGNGTFRVTLPIDIYGDGSEVGVPDPFAYYDWSRTALVLIEVDVDRAELVPVGEVVAERRDADHDWSQGTYGDRGRLDGDAVHYIHRGQVWSASWFDPEAAEGPQ